MYGLLPFISSFYTRDFKYLISDLNIVRSFSPHHKPRLSKGHLGGFLRRGQAWTHFKWLDSALGCHMKSLAGNSCRINSSKNKYTFLAAIQKFSMGQSFDVRLRWKIGPLTTFVLDFVRALEGWSSDVWQIHSWKIPFLKNTFWKIHLDHWQLLYLTLTELWRGDHKTIIASSSSYHRGDHHRHPHHHHHHLHHHCHNQRSAADVN